MCYILAIASLLCLMPPFVHCPDAPWRKGGEKPAVPLKPTNVPPTTAKYPPHRQSPSNPSPPLPRRLSEEQTPSPPPLAHRRVEPSEKLCNDTDEYVMLEDARTRDIPLGKSGDWVHT